jgi:plastocyanin
MKTFLSLLFAWALATTHAGTIVGTVKAQPRPELAEGGAAGGGKYESRKFKFVETVKYDEIKEFVVFIDSPMTNAFATPKTQRVVTQKDATFRPHVMPVMAGTKVEWPNHDEIFHSVFSVSEAKEFDLGLYKDPVVKDVTFDKPGRVDVFCSIHSQMNCVVLVLKNPFFAATDSKGQFKISDVPAGTYKIKAWHERLPGQAKEITVPPEGEVRVDFVVGVGNLAK